MTSGLKFDWKIFLDGASDEMLKSTQRSKYPAEVLQSGWLGYQGATEAEIVALEQKLGRRLPLSYRTFLAVTNGWRDCGPFIYRMWNCSEVRWFQEQNQQWIDAYVHPENSGVTAYDETGNEISLQPQKVTDEDYFVYGDEQDSTQIRVEYLQSALEISDVGDSAILLLNPKAINEDGEWEAWLFANWIWGAVRYRSFQELMEGELKSFMTLQEDA